jgi:hypothetical protein
MGSARASPGDLRLADEALLAGLDLGDEHGGAPGGALGVEGGEKIEPH